jgi:hypothetical protein
LFASIRRGLPRILLLIAVGVINLLLAHLPELAGITGGPLPILCPLAFGAGLVFLCLAAGDAALRVLQPQVDPQAMAQRARTHDSTAAAIVYLGRCILAAAVLILMATAPRGAGAAQPPSTATVAAARAAGRAARALLARHAAGERAWRAGGAGDVHHARAPQLLEPARRAAHEREQGVGLGQLTRAFRADGSTRFDALSELVRAYPKRALRPHVGQPLRSGAAAACALVLKDRQGYRAITGASTPQDQLAMAFAAYNGGPGGLASDRRMCAATTACDKPAMVRERGAHQPEGEGGRARLRQELLRGESRVRAQHPGGAARALREPGRVRRP